MGTVTNSTQAVQFRYPSTSFLERSPASGNLVLVFRSTAGALTFWGSSNNGQTWSDLGISFTRANLQEWSNLWIDHDGFLHFAYRVYESGQDRVYYRRAGTAGGTLAWDTEVLIASATAASAGDVYQGVDIAIHQPYYDAFYVVLAVGTTSGANNGVTLFCMEVYYYDSTWIYASYNSVFSGRRQWLYPGTGRISPNVDIRHTGDGHTPRSTPDLWVSWGSQTSYLVKVAWANGRWAGPTDAITVGTPAATLTHIPARFDGTRYVCPVMNGSIVNVYNRDSSNTTTSVRNSPAHPQGVITYLSMNYVPTTGDFRLYAIGTSNAVLYYIDHIRATNTWGSWISTGTTIVGNNFTTRRSTADNNRFGIVTVSGTSPYTITHTSDSLAFAPNTPVISAPVNGVAQDVAASLQIAWAFSDPDPEEIQEGYALSRQIGAGTVQYWQASTSTWVSGEVHNVSSSSSVTLPSGWGANADATHMYRVKVWDTQSLASQYSVGVNVIPSARVNPTITSPTNLSTITSNQITVTWTVAEQSAFRVQLFKDPGNIRVYDSGRVTSTATTHTIPLVLDDNSNYTVSLTTYNAEGLASATVSSLLIVDFVEPPTPTCSLAVLDSQGVIRVSMANPAPSGGQPALASNEVWRRKVSGFVSTPIVVTALRDSFSRVVDNDWGTSDSGHVWKRNGGTATDYDVSGTYGSLEYTAVNSTRNVYVDTIGRLNQRPEFTFSLNQVPTGATAECFASVRFVDLSNHYRFRFQFQLDGSLRLFITKRIGGVSTNLVSLTSVPGLGAGTISAGTKIKCKGDLVGTTLRCKAWLNGTTEPAGWQLTATDSDLSIGSGFGLSIVPTSGNTNTGLAGRFEDLTVVSDDVTVNPDNGSRITRGLPGNAIYDDFTAASGVDWEYQVVANGVNGTHQKSAWTS